MKYFICEKNGSILCISDSYVEIDDSSTHEIETDEFIDFDKISGYDFANGTLIFNESKWKEIEHLNYLDELRALRDIECFSVINRGEMWYSMNVNTDERKAELESWYKDWLDVTETEKIPSKPSWIN